MTYAPQSLRDLMTLWTGQGGVNLGIVGDTRHQAKGTSYHLGKSQLTSNAYSRITTRDRRGLTEAASAVDLGKLDGTLTDLRKFSTWLYQRCRENAPGTSAIREVIWSPDGKRVMRWDRERGYDSVAFSGEADNSHFGHTHVSFYRDTESADRTVAFRPYFELPDTATEDTVSAIAVTPIGTTYAYIVRIPEKAVTYGPNEGERGTIGPRADGEPWVGNALGIYGLDGAGGRRVYLLTNGGKPVYVAEGDTSITSMKWERGATEPVPSPTPEPTHVVTLTVDGRDVYSTEL